MKTWEVERMFKEDIREKKKTGSGAFHMRGKGVKHGFNGALRTPYHFMKTKEKNKLNGEVEVFNMYTTILNWTEFDLKDEATKKQLLTKWREIYSNEKIMKELSVNRKSKLNSQSFADLVNGLGCPRKVRHGAPSGPKSQPKMVAISAVKQSPVFEQDTLIEFEPVKVPEPQPKPKEVTQGLHLEYNGEYDIEQLTKLFTKLQLLIDGETNKFNISLNLTEIVE